MDSSNETDDINIKSEDNITSGKYIIQYTYLPPIDPLNLLGDNFVEEHDENDKRAEVRYLLEYEGRFMVEYAHGGE